MMCESFHRVNEQSESKGIGEGTGFIEFPVLLLLAVGEIDQAHNQSQQAEGDIDRKKPLPATSRKDDTRNRRACDSRYGNDHRTDPQAAS